MIEPRDEGSASEDSEDEDSRWQKKYVERIVFMVDAGQAMFEPACLANGGADDSTRFEGAMSFVLRYLMQRIRNQRGDKVGLIVYGDGDSSRAVPVLPLARCDVPGAKCLATALQHRRLHTAGDCTAWINSLGPKVLEEEERQEGTPLQSAVYKVESMLENVKDSASHLVCKSALVFTADLLPCGGVEESRERLLRFAGDCADRDIEIRAAIFGLSCQDMPQPVLSSTDTAHIARFWKPMLERASRGAAPKHYLSSAEGVLAKGPQSESSRLPPPAKSARFELRLFDASAPPLAVELAPCYRSRSKPKGVFVHGETGKLVTETKERHCVTTGKLLADYQRRTYYEIGTSGRSYIEPDERLACVDLSGDSGSQRLEIIGFVDIEGEDDNLFLVGPPKLIRSIDEANTDVLAALCGAMLRARVNALAWRITLRSIAIVLIIPLDEGALVVRELPFAGEARRAALEPVDVVSHDDLDEAARDLVEYLATDQAEIRSMPNPCLAKFDAFLESNSLDLGPGPLNAAKRISAEQFPEPTSRLDVIQIAVNDALDRIGPKETPSKNARKRPATTKAERDQIPEKFLQQPPSALFADRDDWCTQVSVHNAAALKAVCEQLGLKKSGKNKDELICRLADHIWSPHAANHPRR